MCRRVSAIANKMRWLDLNPCPAPRMTQADRWKKRPPVLRYFAFRDEIRLLKVEIPERVRLEFVLPMPKSWSRKKRARRVGGPHQQMPDLDNLVKALLDAALTQDCHVWEIAACKTWGEVGRIGIGEIGGLR